MISARVVQADTVGDDSHLPCREVERRRAALGEWLDELREAAGPPDEELVARYMALLSGPVG